MSAASLRLGLLSLVSLTAVAGCAPRSPELREMRAIWVARTTYRTPDDVKGVIANCADTGFNTVFFQVRGNGTALYRSKFEPWAEEMGGKDPGWDPLAVAIEEAHARKIGLHAWVNVMPAWRGRTPPSDPEQLYNKRPEWFWYDQNGERQKLSTFYVSLNPCLPEVREYLVEVFRDIVSRYDMDGLHLDYIRFPNEPPAIPARSGLDYPHDARTLTLYRDETGKAPGDDPAAWDGWRTTCVTRLVGQIHDMVRREKPTIELTSAVGSIPERALRHFQDGKRWLRDGLVDRVVLMNYVNEPAEFASRIEPWLADDVNRARVVPGAWSGRHEGKSEEQIAAAISGQIDVARERTGQFCFFSYGALFPGERRRAPATAPTEPRRDQLLRDYFRALATAPPGR